jgi:hypothetical protein
MICQAGHQMQRRMQFRFDNEPGDSPAVTAALARFRAMGMELGAVVTLWACEPCDLMDAEFQYPGKEDR